MADTSSPPSGFSVPSLCRRWLVGADKIRAWIRAGELVAVNVAATVSGRPQWRVTPESVAAFEERRSSKPAPKKTPRRRRPVVRDYTRDW